MDNLAKIVYQIFNHFIFLIGCLSRAKADQHKFYKKGPTAILKKSRQHFAVKFELFMGTTADAVGITANCRIVIKKFETCA